MHFEPAVTEYLQKKKFPQVNHVRAVAVHIHLHSRGKERLEELVHFFLLKDLDRHVRFKCKVYSFSLLLGCCVLCKCPLCGTIKARLILSFSFSNILKCQLSQCCNSLFVMSICRLWKYVQLHLLVPGQSWVFFYDFLSNIGQLFYRTARSPTELVTSVPWWQTSTGRSCTEASSYTLEM